MDPKSLPYHLRMVHFPKPAPWPKHGRHLRVYFNPARGLWEARTEWWWKGERRTRTVKPHAIARTLDALCRILRKRQERALRGVRPSDRALHWQRRR